MPEKTPIRVRGKRTATGAEKRPAGRKRKAVRDNSPAPSGSSAGTGSKKAVDGNPRKRKRHGRHLSRLEQLPTEILQAIFVHDPNPSLPAASPVLLSQLSGDHVYKSVTTTILMRTLGFSQGLMSQDVASKEDLAASTRLLNSKFMTWDFFKRWLQEQYDSHVPATSPPDQRQQDDCTEMWFTLGPSISLLPPKKLLVGPWTTEKSEFLFLLHSGTWDMITSDPISGELAYEGLAQAISECAGRAVLTLLHLRLRPTTEHLRLAVIDSGCDRGTVSSLADSGMTFLDRARWDRSTDAAPSHGAIPSDIDFFDPPLWSWADQARARGDENGEWLMDLLRKHGRAMGQDDHTAVLKHESA